VLQWGHGDEAVEEVQGTARDFPFQVTLQWGHGDEAVEEEPDYGLHGALRAASMGPRR